MTRTKDLADPQFVVGIPDLSASESSSKADEVPPSGTVVGVAVRASK